MYPCPYCDRSLDSASQRSSHIKNNHIEDYRQEQKNAKGKKVNWTHVAAEMGKSGGAPSERVTFTATRATVTPIETSVLQETESLAQIAAVLDDLDRSQIHRIILYFENFYRLWDGAGKKR